MTQPSRIAILFEFDTLNGGERSMLSVVERMGRHGWEPVALAPPQGRLATALGQLGVDVLPFTVRGPQNERRPLDQVLNDLKAWINQCSPAVVHANSLAMGRLSGAVADSVGVPCTAHLRDILKLSRAAVGQLNGNRRLIAVSEATKAFHVSQGMNADAVQVVYNGVDCDLFQPRPATGFLQRQLGLPDDAFLVLTVGQIGLRKGQDVLAEAACEAAERMPAAHFLLVGERHSQKDESIEFERRLQGRFERAGLVSRFHQLGYRDDVPRLMNEADLLVHPAHQEPFGRVLLEAAAAGLAIVATDVGGTREMLDDGKSALLVPPATAAELARAMGELYDDEQRRRRLGQTARQRVESQFGADGAADELIRVWCAEA